LSNIAEDIKNQCTSLPIVAANIENNTIAARSKFNTLITSKLIEMFKLQNPISDLCLIWSNTLPGTKILQNHRDLELLMKWLDPSAAVQFTLLHQASKHNFSAKAFHNICDGKPHTLILVKSKLGKIFGGYSDITWDSQENYKASTKCFLFSLTEKAKYPIKNQLYAITGASLYGPTFGGGYDFVLADCCHKNTKSYSKLGYSYDYSGADGFQILAGAERFEVEEYEVYQVQFEYRPSRFLDELKSESEISELKKSNEA